MELCKTCKNKNCKRNIKITKQGNLIIIKCLEYIKDKNKIKGYKNPLHRTAKYEATLMGFADSSWNS